MEVLVLGIGDAFSRLHYGSSALLRSSAKRADGGDALVLLDCADLIHRVLHAAGEKAGGSWRDLRAEQIDDVLLTHLHGDHSNGLESFGFYRRLQRLAAQAKGLPLPPVPRLWASREAGARVWDKLAPAMTGALGRQLADFFDLRLLVPGEEAQVAGLRIESRVTTHSLHCLGFRISDPAGGVLGWSGDTGFEQAHVDWLAPAQCIVHEANVPPSHTDIADLARQSPEIKRKLRLLHLPDGFDTTPYGLTALKEGDVLRV